MCEMASGTSSIDKAALCSGWVWMMQLTSGRARYSQLWKRLAGLAMPRPCSTVRSSSTTSRLEAAISSKPSPSCWV
ncbi:hypothetical protein D3C80_1688680 [compost metagenome]